MKLDYSLLQRRRRSFISKITIRDYASWFLYILSLCWFLNTPQHSSSKAAVDKAPWRTTDKDLSN